jgi:sodium transport system permease protein
MTPFMLSLNQGPEPQWFSWSPVLAQNLLMNHILKGEVIGIVPMLSSVGVCVVLTLLSLTYVARKMRSVVVA